MSLLRAAAGVIGLVGGAEADCDGCDMCKLLS